MSSDFEAEIKKLARARADKSPEITESAETGVERGDFLAVLDEFLDISRKAADLYNSTSKAELLKVYELSPDFLEIFLGIGGRRGGFSIVSPYKIAVFFDQDPDMITIIGKFRSQGSGLQANANKTLKLMQLTFSKTDEGFEYKDNTGNKLTLEASTTAVFGWLTSS